MTSHIIFEKLKLDSQSRSVSRIYNFIYGS